jgi:DNA-binding MarR family transcriptional regulator
VATSQIDRHRARELAGTLIEDPSLGEAIVGFARLAELALEEAGLSRIQYRILQHLRHGHTIQSDLAFQLTVTKQSVTRLVDALVDRRYLTRRVDPADRRRVIHAITLKGQRALDHADVIIERYLMLVLQDLDDDADIHAARKGIQLFGRASRASYKRVRPDGIVPGPRSSNPGCRG